MFTAHLNSYRQSPRKVRLVANIVKGKTAAEARLILGQAVKSAAGPLRKLLESALSNAKSLGAASPESLVIRDFMVNGGKTLRRHMPRARGSAYRIRKRTSHITLVLGTKQGR